MGLGLVGTLRVWVSRLGRGSQDGGAVSGEGCRLVQVLLGCVVRVLIDLYLGRMLGKPGGLAGRQHRTLPSLLLASLDPDPDWVELE